jgi:hypothetical protein
MKTYRFKEQIRYFEGYSMHQHVNPESIANRTIYKHQNVDKISVIVVNTSLYERKTSKPGEQRPRLVQKY